MGILMRWVSTALLLIACCAAHSAEILVVTNATIDQKDISIPRLKNLYLGTPLFDGVKPLELTPGHPNRNRFNALVIGMTEARIAAFWAQMRFSGTRLPPTVFSNETELLEYMATTDNVVGYVSQGSQLPEGVKVILEL